MGASPSSLSDVQLPICSCSAFAKIAAARSRAGELSLACLCKCEAQVDLLGCAPKSAATSVISSSFVRLPSAFSASLKGCARILYAYVWVCVWRLSSAGVPWTGRCGPRSQRPKGDGHWANQRPPCPQSRGARNVPEPSAPWRVEARGARVTVYKTPYDGLPSASLPSSHGRAASKSVTTAAGAPVAWTPKRSRLAGGRGSQVHQVGEEGWVAASVGDEGAPAQTVVGVVVGSGHEDCSC